MVHGLETIKKMNDEAAADVVEKIEDRMMKWFAYDHLPPVLRAVSKGFYVIAEQLCDTVAPGPERTVALRKLLEAKDAAVRAAIHPGG